MKTTFKTLIAATIFMFAAYSTSFAQCGDHDCNPSLNGMEFDASCIDEGTTSILEVTWTMGGGDPTCLAPAESWSIQISLPTGEEYVVIDEMTVTGAEFDWTYDMDNFTLNGLSNQSITWLQTGSVQVVITGNFNTGCVLETSNANIQIMPNPSPGLPFNGCTDAFDNEVGDDNKSASLGIDLQDVGLPVDLVGFTAKRKGQTSLLEWTTRVEVNNKGFDIQRSEDGSRFETIGHEVAQTPTTFESHYSFVDATPVRGVNYYRLKQIDNNGKFVYSQIRQLDFDGPEGGKITISPNPVIDKIQVENLKANNIEKIYITDDANKLVRTIEVDATQDEHRYDLSALTSGVYYVRFVGGENVVTEKLIKLSF